ncbi:aldo/keto reductase [Azotobacter sp. CWF10]
MNTRRHFLVTAAAALAAAPCWRSPPPARAAFCPRMGESIRVLYRATPPRWRTLPSPIRLGLGGVAIGNGFAPSSDQQSEQTLEAAWAAGVRYFDTSPWYGLGLSERRFGHFLHNRAPDEYVLSTKVGRVLSATRTPPKTMWHAPSPFAYRYDYSADGVRRSVEDSLQRLGVSQLDIVFVHDLAPSNGDIGERWPEYFEQAAKGPSRN